MDADRERELTEKIQFLKDRVRESSAMIKLLSKGKHPKQLATVDAILSQNTDALK